MSVPIEITIQLDTVEDAKKLRALAVQRRVDGTTPSEARTLRQVIGQLDDRLGQDAF